MIPRYKHLKLTEEQLGRSLRFQYLAVHDPTKIAFPKDFVPTDAVDERVMYLLKRNELKKEHWRKQMIVKNKEYAKRMGILYVNVRLFDRDPEMVKDIMSKMLIVRAELKDFGGGVEYHAYSKEFDEIDAKGATEVPLYSIDLTIEEGSIAGYKIVRL